MRRPFDSLEDFTGRNRARKPPDPPATRYVEPLGTRQQLEPLAVWDGSIKAKRWRSISWPQKFDAFHRSFALAGFALIALIIGSSVYFRISDVAVELGENTNNMAAEDQPANSVATVSEPDPADLVSRDNSLLTFDQDQPVRRAPRQRTNRPRFSFAVSQPRHLLPHPQFIVSDFIPTTLVIYVENGVVKTRIEPQVLNPFLRQRPSSN